jgi:hypothetical protein
LVVGRELAPFPVPQACADSYFSIGGGWENLLWQGIRKTLDSVTLTKSQKILAAKVAKQGR